MKKILFPLFVVLCLFIFTPQAHAATKYWYSASSTDWATSTNWFIDINHATSTTVATSGDDVVLIGSISPIFDLNTSVQPLTIDSTRLTDSAKTSGIIFSAENVIQSYYFTGTTTGNATFNHFAENRGYINGNVVFNGGSNSGVVSGGAIFNSGSGDNIGLIKGDAAFNGYSNNFSIVEGNAVFNDSSFNRGLIKGDATLNSSQYSAVEGNLFFSSTYWWIGEIKGAVHGSDGKPVNRWVFTDEAYTIENSVINGDAYFSGSSTNRTNLISGVAIFCGDNSVDVADAPHRVRYYSVDCPQATTTRNFVSSIPWNISADGIQVNMASSTYNASTTFGVVSGGSFIPTNLVPTGLSISNPATSTTVTLWAPIINWGNSTKSFSYAFDGGDYVDLASATSTIPAPTYGSHTLDIRAYNAPGFTIVSSSFTYSQPVVVSSGGGSSGGSSHGGGGGGGSNKTAVSISTSTIPVNADAVAKLKQELTKQLILALQDLLKQLISELVKLQAGK